MPDLYTDTLAEDDSSETTSDKNITTQKAERFSITEEGLIKLASELLEVVAERISANISQSVDGNDETSSVTGKAVNEAISKAVADTKADIDAGYYRISDINPISDDVIINSVNDVFNNL